METLQKKPSKTVQKCSLKNALKTDLLMKEFNEISCEVCTSIYPVLYEILFLSEKGTQRILKFIKAFIYRSL